MGSDARSSESLATFEVTRSANGRIQRPGRGGGGSKDFFLHRASLGGVAKKRTASRPLFGGPRVALADLGDLTDPGQLNGQGPVLF